MVSKRGNRDQFSNMITTCHAAGVKVITGKSFAEINSDDQRLKSPLFYLTDTIFNHMTAGSGIGIAGSPYTHHIYPGLYDAHNFHYCGLEPNDIIVNYKNRAEVQTCELLGLAE
jgi:hypothetical protein